MQQCTYIKASILEPSYNEEDIFGEVIYYLNKAESVLANEIVANETGFSIKLMFSEN